MEAKKASGKHHQKKSLKTVMRQIRAIWDRSLGSLKGNHPEWQTATQQGLRNTPLVPNGTVVAILAQAILAQVWFRLGQGCNEANLCTHFGSLHHAEQAR